MQLICYKSFAFTKCIEQTRNSFLGNCTMVKPLWASTVLIIYDYLSASFCVVFDLFKELFTIFV